MNTSDSILKLAPALLAAKRAFKPALRTAENPHFKSKYVDLQTVVDATEEALSANGLMLLQTPGPATDHLTSLTTRLLHVSGEWIEDTIWIPAGTASRYDAQTVGSALTYARRYSYMGILGIAPEDDDGSTAAGSHAVAKATPIRQQQHNQPWQYNEDSEPDPMFDKNGDMLEARSTIQHREEKQAAKADSTVPSVIPAAGPVISEPQAKRFLAIAKTGGKTWPEIDAALEAIGVKKAIEIPRNQYDSFIEWAGGKNEKRA